MKAAAAEIQRWTIVVTCLAAGLVVLEAGRELLVSEECGPLEKTVHVLVPVGLAAVPLASAWLAHQKRWREFLLLPILTLTVTAWLLFVTLPGLIPLLDERPFLPDRLTLAKAAFHVIFFFGSFPFANWVYRQLIRLLDRFSPPHRPVKEWIRRSC